MHSFTVVCYENLCGVTSIDPLLFFPKTLLLFAPQPTKGWEVVFLRLLHLSSPLAFFFFLVTFSPHSLSVATNAHVFGLVKASVSYSGLVTFSAV